MLYIGQEHDGRPLVLHNQWSIRVRDAEGERQQHVGKTVITTLEPGKELGLAAGASLLEGATTMATITDRCAGMPGEFNGMGLREGR